MFPSPPSLLALLAAALLAGGCASPRAPVRHHEALGSLTIPPSAGIVGLSHDRPDPAFVLNLPASRRETMEAISDEIQGNDPFAIALFPVHHATRAVIAGVSGALLGAAGEQIGPAQDRIAALAREYALHVRIDRLLRGHLAPLPLRELEGGLPVEPRSAHGRMRIDGSSRLVWTAGPPEPHPLQGTSIGTLLSVRNAYHGFRAAAPTRREVSNGIINDYDPPLMLVVAVELAAVRVDDWSPLGHITLRCESGPHHFTTWGADDARLLRAELAAAWIHIERELSTRLIRSATEPAVPRPRLPGPTAAVHRSPMNNEHWSMNDDQ